MKMLRLAHVFLAICFAVALLGTPTNTRAQTDTGEIAGTILDTNNTAIFGVNVCALNYDVGGNWVCAQSGIDGTYLIEELPSADYRVQAYASGWGLQNYNGVYGWWAASRVSVVAGSTVGGINFALVPGGQISGTVYQTDGITPIPDMGVSIASPDYSRVVCTNSNGQYSIDFVAYGMPWKVGAGPAGCPGSTGYGSEFWHETRYWESATPLVLSAGVPYYSGIDFTLDPAGTISGTVRDVAGNPIVGTSIGVNVEGADSEGLPSDVVLSHACTDGATGQYTLTNVPLDAPMFVWAGDNQCDQHIFGQEWWQHAFLPWNGTGITLSPPATDVTGIDFSLGTKVTANTPTGSAVSIAPFSGLTVTFGSVTQGGVTTAIATQDSTSDTPSGFLMNGAIYSISSSAVFTSAQVCLNYSDAGLSENQESQLKLYHGHNANWVDVTDPGYPQVSGNLICGTVTSLSPFAILLATSPTTADQCKNDGWKTFSTPRTFKNQGDCIQFVQTGK